ncbi:iron chaperone [Cohnella sp. GCM10027633]|uniref:iron chaperone n=1 Tax=unclassified Cohnella TaxID=2636738 RepID=UPI00363CBDF1
MAKTDYQNPDEYIRTFPKEVQEGLELIRRTVKEAVPEATEAISYQIPVFEHHGKLIYYSAYAKHYSLSFPPPFAVFEAFKERLSRYAVSKSAVQLPMSEPLPTALIADMVKFNARENENKPAKKRK